MTHEYLGAGRSKYLKVLLASLIPTVHVEVSDPYRVIGVHVGKEQVARLPQVLRSQVPEAMATAPAAIEQQFRIARLNQNAGPELPRVWSRCACSQKRDLDRRFCLRIGVDGKRYLRGSHNRDRRDSATKES